MARNRKTYILDIMEELRPARRVRRRVSSRDFSDVVAFAEKTDYYQPMLKLFEHGHQDHRDPWAWLRIMGLVADEFMNEKKPGVRRKWNRPAPETLKNDLHAVAKTNPRLSGKQLIEAMKVQHSPRYAAPVATILRWLSEERISIKAVKKSVRAKRQN
ncbi:MULTISPECIES: hypothetical protein [Bradyrhizobium]|uniref:hypothetical protein n=1 Tax=Bradyrhizobium TaxID=374 RepID=UPI000D731610|nr:hypothetical protein [Bradyrhizobium diazoefficiens]AWO87802.1 hypothetical protein DI395_03970 [Bradyrhizobium diazoefficiens]